MKRDYPLQFLCLLGLLFLLTGAGFFVRGEDRPGPGVFLPAQSDLQILWQRLEEAREQGKWDAVVEGLSTYAALIKRPEINSVVSSGGGVSLGIRSLLSRLIDNLPAEAL